MPLNLCGFLVLGAGIQHLNLAAVIMGWGIAEMSVMINTVVICMCLFLHWLQLAIDVSQTRIAMTASQDARWVYSTHD